ncbi:MAG: CocE/NonD family hydrolase C-terminal non-catalytic domain-containing protein [Streptosporangiaceae bacterium]
MTVPMSATAHRFAPGHRIRLMLAGGAHPRFARNTGTGEPIATAVSLRAVNIEFSHGAEPACGLCLPVVPATAAAGMTG